jgi:hypothetical protein
MFVSRMYANARGVAMFIASLRTIAWVSDEEGRTFFTATALAGLSFNALTFDAAHGRASALAPSSSSTCCGSAC